MTTAKTRKTPGAFKDASLAKLRIGTSRKYPRHADALRSTAAYAAAYYALNHATRFNQFHMTSDAAFFAPLSEAPTTWPQDSECVHEVLNDAGQWVAS
jgi:hypothetical protein